MMTFTDGLRIGAWGVLAILIVATSVDTLVYLTTPVHPAVSAVMMVLCAACFASTLRWHRACRPEQGWRRNVVVALFGISSAAVWRLGFIPHDPVHTNIPASLLFGLAWVLCIYGCSVFLAAFAYGEQYVADWRRWRDANVWTNTVRYHTTRFPGGLVALLAGVGSEDDEDRMVETLFAEGVQVVVCDRKDSTLSVFAAPGCVVCVEELLQQQLETAVGQPAEEGWEFKPGRCQFTGDHLHVTARDIVKAMNLAVARKIMALALRAT